MLEWRNPVWNMDLPDLQDPETGETISMANSCELTVEAKRGTEILGVSMLLRKDHLEYWPEFKEKAEQECRQWIKRKAGLDDE